MRTNLFLSTLIAVSLVGAPALAGKPGAERPAREPRAVQILRSRGDMVDKSYRAPDRAAIKAHINDTSARKAQAHGAPRLNERSLSRINCSDSGADCGTSSRNTVRPDARGVKSAPAKPGAQAPLASPANERMNCNEAAECNLSSKGAKKAWAQNAGTSSPTEKPGAASRKMNERTLMQPSSSRMVCNEADECMMSSKDAKKIWAYESVKAGTFHGPTDVAAQKDTRAQDKKEQAAKEQRAKDAASQP